MRRQLHIKVAVNQVLKHLSVSLAHLFQRLAILRQFLKNCLLYRHLHAPGG